MEIGAPGPSSLIEVVVTDVGGDRGVHAAYDAIEYTLFKAFVVQGEIQGRGAGLDDGAEVVGGLEDAQGLWVAGKGSCGNVFGEAVFSVDGVPDVGPCVAGETLRVLY